MAKEKPLPPEDNGDVPAWFMTYSDVITLLMTFFILLLTFASQEPESFDRIKVSMFGGGGSDGIAGRKQDALDRESVTLRYRPDKSRLTQHGSETPPLNTDVKTDGLDKGLKALSEESDLVSHQRVTFSTSRNAILTPDGQLTSTGRRQMAKFAKQLIRRSMKLAISVPRSEDLPAVIQIAHDMTYEYGVPLGKVSILSQTASNSSTLDFTLTRAN